MTFYYFSKWGYCKSTIIHLLGHDQVVQVAEISVVNGWPFVVPFASLLVVVVNKCIVSLNARVAETASSLWLINRPGSPLEALIESIEVDWRNEVHESMTKMSSPMTGTWHVEEVIAQSELVVDDSYNFLESERRRNVFDHDGTTTILDDELRNNLVSRIWWRPPRHTSSWRLDAG